MIAAQVVLIGHSEQLALFGLATTVPSPPSPEPLAMTVSMKLQFPLTASHELRLPGFVCAETVLQVATPPLAAARLRFEPSDTNGTEQQ